MRIAFLIVVGLLLLGVAGGFVYLGLYPPGPRARTVDRVVPNDQFKTH